MAKLLTEKTQTENDEIEEFTEKTNITLRRTEI